MASGISLLMRAFSGSEGARRFRRVTRDDIVPRNRALRGKARIKARKARNKRGW